MSSPSIKSKEINWKMKVQETAARLCEGRADEYSVLNVGFGLGIVRVPLLFIRECTRPLMHSRRLICFLKNVRIHRSACYHRSASRCTRVYALERLVTSITRSVRHDHDHNIFHGDSLESSISRHLLSSEEH